jgi:hypothetical protein
MPRASQSRRGSIAGARSSVFAAGISCSTTFLPQVVPATTQVRGDSAQIGN